MMANWSEIRFSEAAKEQRFNAEFWQPGYLNPLQVDRKWTPIGKLLKQCQYGLSREMNEEGIGSPIYRMNEMDGPFLSVPEKCVVVSESEQKEFQLRVNDVLFNRTNSYRWVGRTGILKEPSQAVFASYLIRLVPDTDLLLPEYLTAYLNCPTGVAQVKRRAMESINQTNVSGSEIKKVPIPLIPMKLQKEVKTLLDKAAGLRLSSIEKCRIGQELLLKSLKFDDLDTSHNLSYTATFKDLEKWARSDAEFYQPKYERLLKHLKKQGQTKQLGAITTRVQRGVQPVYIEDGDVLVVNSKHVGPQMINVEQCLRTNSDFWKKNSRARVEKGDVVMNSTGIGTIGRTNLVMHGEPTVVDNHVCIIQTDNTQCLPGYLAAFLNSPVGSMQTDKWFSGSSGQIEIYPDQIKQFLVYLAPMKIQELVSTHMNAAFQERTKARLLAAEAIALVEKIITAGF